MGAPSFWPCGSSIATSKVLIALAAFLAACEPGASVYSTAPATGRIAAFRRSSIALSAKGDRPSTWRGACSSSLSMGASPYVSAKPTRPSEVSSSTMARSAQGSWMPAALSNGPSRKATGVVRMRVMRTSRFMRSASVGAGAGLLHQQRPARDLAGHQRRQFVGAARDDLHAHLLAELLLHVGLLQGRLDLAGEPLHDRLGRALGCIDRLPRRHLEA